MKKVFVFGIALMAVLAFAAAPSFACGEKANASTTKTDGKLASSQYSCSVSKTSAKLASSSTTDGKLANSGKGCSAYASYNKLGKNASLVSASHYAHCGVKGTCQLVNVSVKGMTCGGCESGLSAAMAKIEGVNKVVNVDYAEGIAQVCVKNDFNTAALSKAVTAKGFEARIIPAVAKSTSSADKATLSNSTKHDCAAVCKAANAKNASARTVSKKEKSSDNAKGDTY